jgi:hypothetical protein
MPCLRCLLATAVLVVQETDPAHAAGLLRARRERPRGRAAEQRDELAANN